MTESLSLTGKFLGAARTEMLGANKDFAVRKFWLDTTDNPEWPNTPEFQLKKDRVSLVDNLGKGQLIKVTFQLEGRKYDNTAKGGKKGVITNCVAYKIDVVHTQSAATLGSTPGPAPAAPRPAPAAPAIAPAGALPFGGDETDDLSF
jgi:hypothetical protein